MSADTPEIVDERRQDVVDPQIRAHIYSLCTALGGPSVEDGKYALGDEALAVLKDLRQWLRLYDRALNRYDVARCLSEMNLVKADLLEIISMWREEDVMVKSKHRIVLSCVELLAPLTWAFDKTSDQMTVNHHRHIPVLEQAQMKYKKAILTHSSGKILKNIIRVALPSMAIPLNEREDRDDGIISIVLHTLRNIAQIEHQNPTEMDTGEDIGRSATINAFQEQNVFDLLLTAGSGMGEDFRTQDVLVMEILYQLFKGVNAEPIFKSEGQVSTERGKNLTMLLKKEDEMKRASSRAATRHNRFGTTVWMERDDGSRSFVSGQDALIGKTAGLDAIDKNKKWKKPRGVDAKGVSKKTDFDMRIILDNNARDILRQFVENFIDSSFNPLFQSIRKAIDRDVDRLLDTNSKQYFYAVAWLLKAERIRRNAKAKDKKNSTEGSDGFAVIAGVLNQEFLIILNRKMSEWYEMKQWNELQAGMQCFTQIMYTVQDMAQSPVEDDQEIAENIQNRLFYEETTMLLIYDILRSYTKQPFRWLDDCTEMVHVHLRLLEKYSQQHQNMFIRSRRRQNRKRKEKAKENGEADDDADEDEEALAAASKRAIAERSFDFQKFELRFLNPKCIDSFVAYLRYYRELNESQIMRAIKFFHRVVEKRKMEVLLYRLDIVDLFYHMMQGSDCLPKSNPAYRQVDQFSRHLLRKLFKKLEQEPSLYVELLFTKMNSSLHYLQYGYDREIRISKPRAAAELEVKAGMSQGDSVGVVVAALLNDNKPDALEWLKHVFKTAYRERQSFEDETATRELMNAETNEPPVPPPDVPHFTITPDNDERRAALFKDGKLRLLLKTLGAERLDVNDEHATTWVLPSQMSATQIQTALCDLQKHTDAPPEFDDGLTPEDFIRRAVPLRKPAAKRPGALSSDSDDSAGEEDFEQLFQPGGMKFQKPLWEKKKKEKKGGKRKRDGVSDEVAEERRKEREHKQKEKLSKIKSAMYIIDSDEDIDDDEFWKREEDIRSRGPKSIFDSKEPEKDTDKDRRKRRKVAEHDDIVMDDSESEGGVDGGEKDDSQGDDSESPPASRSRAASTPESDDDVQMTVATSKVINLPDEDEEDMPTVRAGRKRTAVVIDSDEE